VRSRRFPAHVAQRLQLGAWLSYVASFCVVESHSDPARHRLLSRGPVLQPVLLLPRVFMRDRRRAAPSLGLD
jgi:hypothetical protein